MMKESIDMIYFRIQVFGSGFLQFGHLHSVGHVDFNWAEAWVIVNGLLLDIPMSNEVYAVGDITNLTFQQVRRSHHNLFFFLISQCIITKAQRGATLSTLGVYKRD
jgi:hypothetical protein